MSLGSFQKLRYNGENHELSYQQVQIQMSALPACSHLALNSVFIFSAPLFLYLKNICHEKHWRTKTPAHDSCPIYVSFFLDDLICLSDWPTLILSVDVIKADDSHLIILLFGNCLTTLEVI